MNFQLHNELWGKTRNFLSVELKKLNMKLRNKNTMSIYYYYGFKFVQKT